MMVIVLTGFAYPCLFQAGLYRENTVQMARAQEHSVIALQTLKRKKQFLKKKKVFSYITEEILSLYISICDR